MLNIQKVEKEIQYIHLKKVTKYLKKNNPF